jgi:dinuclear metal center YbgI/SA1388 family protein
MLLQEFLAFFEQKAPKITAEEWDNVGLLVDCGHTNITKAVVALDATKAALTFAKENGAQVLITHHPVIFSPLTALSHLQPAVQALQNGVSVLSLHTNLDKAAGGVNDTLAAVLGLQNVTIAADGMTRIGTLNAPLSAADFAALCAEKLNTPVTYCGEKQVKTVAVCGGGAGGGVFSTAGVADAYVTGEIKHHEWLAANTAGLVAVAAGHYATENPVVDAVASWLADTDIQVLPFYDTAPYKGV